MTEPSAPDIPAPTVTVENIYRGAVGGDAQTVTVYGFVNGNVQTHLTMKCRPYCDFSLWGVNLAVPVHLAPAEFEEYKTAIAFHDPDTDTGHIPLVAVTGVVKNGARSALAPPEVAWLDAEHVQRIPLPEGFRYGDDMTKVLDEILDPHAGRLSVGLVPPAAFERLVEIHDEWAHEHCGPDEGCPGNTSERSAAELRGALHTIREYLDTPEEYQDAPKPDGLYHNTDREGALRWVLGVLEAADGTAR